MKVQDFVIFGSNATAALAPGVSEDITWEHNNLTYYEVDQNEAVELIELGILPDAINERVFVRNKDNMDWFEDGFIALGASVGYNCNELPYMRRPDFSKILAPIAPDAVQRASPTLKLPTGDYLRVNKSAFDSPSVAAASKTQAVAIVRKYKAQNSAEQEVVQNYDSLFGGLNSNGQLWHENGTIASAGANVWTDVITLTLLKNELYAFNKVGIWYAPGLSAGEADKVRVYIDDQIEYNKYPCPALPDSSTTSPNSQGMNFLPFNDGIQGGSMLAASSVSEAQNPDTVVPRMYIFDKPLVVSRQFNKSMRLQLRGTAAFAVTNTPTFARMTGMKYRLGA